MHTKPPKHWKCFFCGRSDSQPSKEDVLAKWIVREYDAATPTITVTDGETGKVRKARGNAGILTYAPCHRCNTGWMSRLEKEVKPIIIELMKGNNLLLTSSMKLVLSKWLLKTCSLYDYTKNGRSFFNSAERKHLFEQGLIPRNAHISAARYVGDSRQHSNRATGMRGQIHRTTFRSPDKKTAVEGCWITIVIEQAAFQLFALREDQLQENVEFTVNLSYDWSHHTIQIYPSIQNSQWPPEFALNDSELKTFMERWGDTVH